MVENLCKKCIHIDQKPSLNPCLDCDHRVNKIEHRNNFQPKKTAFQKWNEKEFWGYNEATEDIPDLVGRERKKTWNAAIDAVLSLDKELVSITRIREPLYMFRLRDVKLLREP